MDDLSVTLARVQRLRHAEQRARSARVSALAEAVARMPHLPFTLDLWVGALVEEPLRSTMIARLHRSVPVGLCASLKEWPNAD